jgi:hypothetical protein
VQVKTERGEVAVGMGGKGEREGNGGMGGGRGREKDGGGGENHRDLLANGITTRTTKNRTCPVSIDS